MMKLSKKPFLKMLPTLLIIASLSLFLIVVGLYSLSHIIGFSGYAANGAFQLMNPLTRLADGQVIGRDFQFFHGAGVALVHFPLFILFGQGLFGSEMSRWFTSIILFTVSTFFICYTWHRSSKDRFNATLFSFALILLLSWFFAEVITPSNSLLGIRSTMPLIIASVLLFKDFLKAHWVILKGKVTVRLWDILVGTSLALAVLLGTEHGIAAILAFILLTLFQAIPRLKKKRFLVTLKTFSIALLPVALYGIISLFILASIVSLGHPLELLRYSLLTVPGDQFWYYGAEPQGYLSLKSLVPQLLHPSMYPLYLWVGITAVGLFLAKKYRLLTKIQWTAILFLIAYGLLTLSSFLGYFSPSGQIVGTLRVLIIVNVFIIGALVIKLLGTEPRIRSFAMPALLLATSTILISVSLHRLAPLEVKPLIRSTVQNIRGDHRSLYGQVWTDRTNEFQPYIEQAKKSGETPLWSTYASLYERQNGLIHPSSEGFDYIIHALGESRDTYTQDFITKKPVLVTTLRPSYFGFEEWLWGRHADFYKHLVLNYSIVAENDAHVLWQRNPSPTNITKPMTIPLPIDDSTNTIALPRSNEASSRLLEVEVEYTVSAPLGLKKLPRYMVKPSHTTSTIGFSLPPNKTSWKFLLVLKNNEDKAKLAYYADGLLPDATLKIHKVTYTPISLNDTQEAFFTEESLFLKPTPQ